MSEVPVFAHQVKFEDIDFIWDERIPLKMITVIAGQPDQRKGLFGAYLSAQVSKAGHKVIHSAIEDGNSTMTGPRLKAAGANMRNIILWSFRLPTEFAELEAAIVKDKVKLIVIDPLASHLDGVKRSSDGIRAVSDPLKLMLERHNCACVIIEHAIKRVPSGANPLSAIGGTNSGLPAAARCAYLYGTDPDDPTSAVLACVKANAFAKPAALRFDMDLATIDGLKRQVPYLVPGAEIAQFDPIKLVSRRKDEVMIGRPAKVGLMAQEWLWQHLQANGGTAKAKDVNEAALSVKLTARTLRRAAIDMNIRREGSGSQAVWSITPDSVAPGPVPDEDPSPSGVNHAVITITDTDLRFTDHDARMLLDGGLQE